MFVAWLLDQTFRSDLVGELAQQVARRRWPDTDNLQALRVRLAKEAASPSAYQALALAFQEWGACQHLPLLNSPRKVTRFSSN